MVNSLLRVALAATLPLYITDLRLVWRSQYRSSKMKRRWLSILLFNLVPSWSPRMISARRMSSASIPESPRLRRARPTYRASAHGRFCYFLRLAPTFWGCLHPAQRQYGRPATTRTGWDAD